MQITASTRSLHVPNAQPMYVVRVEPSLPRELTHSNIPAPAAPQIYNSITFKYHFDSSIFHGYFQENQ